jgi:hypothetical protein
MMQSVFDSGDLSASATLGAANGMGAGGAGTGGGGGSGSWLYGAETRQV